MTGRHTGSFFLKVGAALFCIGHIIHNGVIFTRQLIPLLTEDYTGEKRFLYSCLSSLENRYIYQLYFRYMFKFFGYGSWHFSNDLCISPNVYGFQILECHSQQIKKTGKNCLYALSFY